MISIGVDVGTFSIKIAEVEATSKSYVIRRIVELPLSLDLTKDKKIEVIDKLRTVFESYDKEKAHFVFSVPAKSVSSRLLQFPFRERFKVQKAIASQLEDELPFAVEETVFDAKIVRYRGKGAEALAVAAPNDRVGEILALAGDCGITPQIVSTDSLALANIFEKWWDPPPETPAPAPEAAEAPLPPRSAELILHIGHLTSQMLIYADGALLAIRSIDWGAKNIADAIAIKYGLNYIQGLTELQTKGFVLLDKTGTKEQVAFSQVIEKALGGLISELRLKMFELQSEMNLTWMKAALMGGGAQLRNLGAYLTQQLEISFNRFKQFEVHPTMNAEANPHLEMVTGVAVGLALEGLKRPRNPAVNLLKGIFARQSHFFESLWEKWGYTAQIAGVAFVVLMIYSITRDSLSLHLRDESDAALKTQAKAIANLDGRKASSSQIEKFLSEVEKKAKDRKQAERVVHINSALDILNLVSKSVPLGRDLPFEIRRFSVDSDTVEVHGLTAAADRARLMKALTGLSSNRRLENITPQVPATAGKTPFAVRFKVQRFTGG